MLLQSQMVQSKMGQHDRSETDWIMLISGVVWIPYCLLMLYLFYEQFKYRRFPQYIIIFCLFLGNCFRCIWFLAFESTHNELGMAFINRIGILFQFTALTLLLMMWSRVLRVSNRSHSNLAEMTAKLKISAPEPPTTDAITPASSLQNGASSPPPTSKISQEFESASKSVNYILWVTVMVNIIVWFIVLLTIGVSTGRSFYNINITMLAGVCFFEGMIIMIVGISTGLRISRELSPVFISWRLGTQEAQKTRCMRLYEFMVEIYSLFFAQSSNRSHRLHAQAEAIQRLVLVSSIIAFFFFIRSFAFLYLLYISS
jgi:hypothetical protein